MSADFSDRVTGFFDFTTGSVVSSYPYDDYGHGTHVAGTIAGSGALSFNHESRGLAPNVKLVVLKVLDQNGAGYTSDVIRAIDFAVLNRVSDASSASTRCCTFKRRKSPPRSGATGSSHHEVLVLAAARQCAKCRFELGKYKNWNSSGSRQTASRWLR